jgi:hypothetical protein
MVNARYAAQHYYHNLKRSGNVMGFGQRRLKGEENVGG